MIDRLFLAALSLCLLAAGTLAIGSAWFQSPAAGPQANLAPVVRVVQLPAVEVTGKRAAPGTTLARTEAVEPAASQLQ